METASRPEIDLRRDLIKPLPSQEKALNALYNYEYILFGGAAGPGKSHTMRWAAIEFLMWCFVVLGLKNVKVGLFCEDYPSLKDRHISKMKREFPAWLGAIKDTQAEGLGFFLRDEYGGGMIALRNLDDPSKYASSEFAAIFVDELTKNNRQTFDDLRFRKRWPGIEHSPFFAASNPGSIGHAWVKKLWLDRDFTGDDSGLNGDSFAYIPARAKENPYLPESYWDTLRSLPPKMRRAMEEGNWDVFVGQYFGDWNRDYHICDSFEIPNDWTKIIAGDYGFVKPSAIGWWAIDPDGDWYLYREVYQPGFTYPEFSKQVLEHTPIDEYIKYAVFDPAIWGDRDKMGNLPGKSGGDVVTDALHRRDIPVYKANNNRIEGWQQCRELLKIIDLPDGRKRGRLHVFSPCINFIRTVPSLVHDDTRVEDLDTDGEDHHADQWRYAVNTKEDLSRKAQSSEGAYFAALQNTASNGGYSYR